MNGTDVNQLLTWLLDLERVDLQSGTGFSLQWQAPLAAWMWFIILLAVPAYIYLIYRHESAPLRRRVVMAATRTLAVLLILLLLSRPMLVSRRDRIEPSTVAVMLDRSASMQGCDQYSAADQEQINALLGTDRSFPERCSRWQLARSLLGNEPGSILPELLRSHRLRVFDFGGSISGEQNLARHEDIAALNATLQSLTASAQESRIAGSLEAVFEACLDAHLTGIVLLTDGQPTEVTDWSRVLAWSHARASPVYPVVIGSPDGFEDLALHEVQADEQVFAGDRVAVRCRVSTTGLKPGTTFDLVLRDASTGETLASHQAQAHEDSDPQPIELQFQPRRTGVHDLFLEIPPLEGERQTANNFQQLQVRIIDDRIRVLYIDGYPRYEYRYLKNTLLREASFLTSILLISADAEFAQEGEEPIRRFPADMEELGQFDVILLGDVDPADGWITSAQMELIAEFVSRRAGGLGLIAGERHGPERLIGTPLEKLIPVTLGSGPNRVTPSTTANKPYHPRLSAVAADSPILRLIQGPDGAGTDFESLPPWYWCHAAAAPKPGVEVLLEHPEPGDNGDRPPLLVTGRYGAGRVVYQGSDDSWRWRRGQGEGLFDTYWIQLVRHLARYKKLRPDTPVALRCRPQRTDDLAPVLFTAEFNEPIQASDLPAEIAVTVTSSDTGLSSEARLTRQTPEARRFQGSYLPGAPGHFEISFDPRTCDLDGPPVRTWLEVESRSLESRKPHANLQLMTDLAQQTGGRVLRPWDAAAIEQLIPQRQYVIPDDVAETVWDSKLAMLLFLALILSEWILRKLSGLP